MNLKKNDDKKLVIFDLDGTLLDTAEDLMTCMNIMLDEISLPRINLVETKAFIGCGARQFVARALKGESRDLDACLKAYNRIYTSGCAQKTKPFDGIGDSLKFLKNQGILLAIMSNKPQAASDEVYKKYLGEYDFDFVYGNRAGYAHKPAADGGELILKELNVAKNNTVMVGDGETDVCFAENLGVKSVSVLWGFRSREQLTEAGAKLFCDNPYYLGEMLCDLLK